MVAINPDVDARVSHPASFPLAPLARIHSLLRVTYYLLLIISIGILANVLLLSSALLWCFHPSLAYELNSLVAGALWTWMQGVFERDQRAVITFSGDDVPAGESAIVIANHMGYSDFYLINALALRKGMLPYCRWFAKASLKWQLPVFGLSMYLMGMVMVKRDWLKDRASIIEAFRNIKSPPGKGKPVWLVTFLEGTRLTEKKLVESQKFAENMGLPVLENLLLPRTKGFVAAVRELRNSHVTAVYDLTLLSSPFPYPSPLPLPSLPSLLHIHSSLSPLSPQYTFHLHVRRYSLSSLPLTDEGVAEWVVEMWKEKDKVVRGWREGGGGRWEGLRGGEGRGGGVWRDDWWRVEVGRRLY